MTLAEQLASHLATRRPLRCYSAGVSGFLLAASRLLPSDVTRPLELNGSQAI